MRKFRLTRIPIIRYRSRLINPSGNVIPEQGDPDSEDFSFAGFDWISFADRLENEQLTDQQTIAHQGALTWIPLDIELHDGSRTVGFKIQKSEKEEFDRLADSDLSAAQKFLLSHASQVLTTPSKSDRMRGVKARTLVVRTPSSLIDLLDDEVPDLREGMVYEPQNPKLLTGDVRPLAGAPWGLMLELAHAIFDRLTSDGHNLSMGTLLKVLGRLAVMGNGIAVIGRLISAISSGELSRFISDHANEDVYDCIMDWYTQFLLGEKLSNPDENPSAGLNEERTDYGGAISPDVNTSSSSPIYPHGVTEPSTEDGVSDLCYDRDYAVVPIRYWRYLYRLGDSFNKKDREPNFSRLALTGSPGTDMLLNRVPSIFINQDGSYTNDYSRYSYPLLCGGLFKKIKNAVKKVGKAVGKVGAAVAKGVAKVMDGPLGGVISAIPVVGNIASVAGKVAKGVTKVIDKVKSIKNKISSVKDKIASSVGAGSSGSDVENLKEIRGDMEHEDSYGPEDNRRAYGAASGVGVTQSSDGSIDIASLPVWSTSGDARFHAPTVSFLTGDGTLHVNPHSGIGKVCQFKVSSDPDLLTDFDRARTQASISVYDLSNTMRNCRHPEFACDWDYGKSPSPEWLSNLKIIPHQLAGDPFEEVVSSETPHLSEAASYLGLDGLIKSIPSQNPFLSVLMQMYADNDTRKLFDNAARDVSINTAALNSYMLNPPYSQRFTERGMNWPVVGVTSIAWSVLLCSTESLSNEIKREAAEIMRRAAESGCFTGRGIDALLPTIIKGEWPDIASNRSLAKTWLRSLSSAIAWMWSEANSSGINSLASSLTVCFVPSYQITSAFIHDFLPKARSQGSDGDSDHYTEVNNQDMRDKALEKASAIDSKSTTAGKDFDALIKAMTGGSSDPDHTAFDAVGIGSSHGGDIGEFASPRNMWGDGFSHFQGDMWDAAIMAIKTTASWQAARLKMVSLGLPPSIISTALEKFYGSYMTSMGNADHSNFLSIIPLTREDSINYNYVPS
jgi:hypothetical protein